MTNVDFTDEELYMIEKVFDEACFNTQRDIAMIVARISGKSKQSDEIVGKLLDEGLKSYDLFRTISAKCSIAYKNKGDKIDENV